MTKSLLQVVENTLTPFTASLCIDASSVLVLAPHPDDEVFGCGGAIASHLRAGTPVQVVVLTNGDKGGDSVRRREESRAAGKVLGYGEPVFWELADRNLQWSEALQQRVCDQLTAHKVDLLYAPSPWELHPDHRHTALLAIQAVRRLHQPGLRIAFYEISSPLRANVLLDVTQSVEVKTRAMGCFTSQLAQQDYADHVLALNRYRTYTLPRATQYAEAFSVHDNASLERHLDNGFFRSSAVEGHVDALHNGLDKPLVSVLIRSLDRPYLMQALDSVALQTYPCLEVVVVCASAEHQALPDYCGAFPLRTVRLGRAVQRSEAANLALDQARGEYLLFLDDDDWLMPSHIERLADTLTRTPDAPATYTGVSMTDAHGSDLGQKFDMPYDSIQQLAGNLTPIHAVLFRASAVRDGCRFDESLDRYEDWDFWLQVSQRGPMVHLPGVSAVYRVHESSGVHVDSGPLGATAQIIYQKWRSRWSAQELGAMMQRVWSYHEQGIQLAELKRQDTQLLEVVNQHSAVIADQVAQIASQRTRLSAQDAQLDTQRGQIELQHTQLNEQRTQIELQHTQLSEQRTQIELQHTQLSEQHTQIELQHTQLSRQCTQRDIQDERIGTLTAEIGSKTAQIESARTAIELLQRSRSWRITRPLRWISAIVQRINKA